MPKPKNISFSIKSVEIISSSISEPLGKAPNSSEFIFDVNLDHRIHNEFQLIIILVSIDIRVKDKETKYGSFKAMCSFSIENFDDYVNKINSTIDIPNDILITFISISISTTRGLMFAHFKGTHLHHALLPVINPNDFTKKTK